MTQTADAKPTTAPDAGEVALMIIAGERLPSNSGATYEVKNPATGKVVATVARGTPDDVNKAVAAAKAVEKQWAETPAEDRAALLFKGIELLEQNKKEIAKLLSQEQGKPVFEANGEVHHMIHGLTFYAGLASKIRGSQVPVPPAMGKHSYGMIVRRPVGISVGITPWNFPLTLMGTKVGPALIAGCPIIIKPAQTTPLSTLRVIELLNQAGIPAGVLQCVTGFGSELGDPATVPEKPRVRMGPLHAEFQWAEIENQLADAVAKGAKVVLGGKRPEGLDEGFYFEPTIVENVSDDSKLVTEEVFGPVLPVFKYKDLDEAIARVNASEWGLGSSIWTNNMIWANRAVRDIEAGVTWVNTIHYGYDELPFGGVKASGIGREHGPEAVDFYLEDKGVVFGGLEG